MVTKISGKIIEFVVSNRRAELYAYILVFLFPILICFTLKGHYIYLWEVVTAMYGFGKSSFMILDKVSINNMGVMLLMLFFMIKIAFYGIKIADINQKIAQKNKGKKYAHTAMFKSNAIVWAVFSATILTMCINIYLGWWPLLYIAFFLLSKSIGNSLKSYKKNINELSNSIPINAVKEELGNLVDLDGVDLTKKLREINIQIEKDSRAIIGYSEKLKEDD